MIIFKKKILSRENKVFWKSFFNDWSQLHLAKSTAGYEVCSQLPVSLKLKPSWDKKYFSPWISQKYFGYRNVKSIFMYSLDPNT